MDKSFIFFSPPGLRALKIKNLNTNERIQILLFPLRSALEVRSVPRGPADSVSDPPSLDPHAKSGGGQRLHSSPAGIRRDLGHARSQKRQSLIDSGIERSAWRRSTNFDRDSGPRVSSPWLGQRMIRRRLHGDRGQAEGQNRAAKKGG